LLKIQAPFSALLLGRVLVFFSRTQSIECPFIRANEDEDWNIPDLKEMLLDQFRKIRRLIDTNVKNLYKLCDCTGREQVR